MLSLYARLVSIDENARLNQIHNSKTEQKLNEIQRKVEYLYNQAMANNRTNEEQDRKLDQIFDFVSNGSRYPTPPPTCEKDGICFEYPIDCNAVYQSGGQNTGIYKIKPVGAPIPVDVYCDMSGPTKWTVILSRYDGSVSFDRTWADYKAGFGDVSKEHWLGLDTMHYLTNQRRYRVRFEMREWQSAMSKWAEFSTFKIGPESSKYRLTISGESGTTTKGRMSYHNGKPFTTKDEDNDQSSDNCAVKFVGGWWHVNCYHPFLTGPYTNRCATTRDHKCTCWDYHVPLDRAIGKIARV